MTENESRLLEILQILEKEKILKDVILIGSWCTFLYKTIFDDFHPIIRTLDIDFYVPDSKRVREKENVILSLKSLNYSILQDCLTNKTTFIYPAGFELEFITKLNRKGQPCVELGNTNIYAESISYVDIFSYNYVEVDYKGIIVKVASPSSYIIQKLLINDLRKDKAEKDLLSIKQVLSYVQTSKKYTSELQSLFTSLPKKWRNKIEKCCKINYIKLPLKG